MHPWKCDSHRVHHTFVVISRIAHDTRPQHVVKPHCGLQAGCAKVSMRCLMNVQRRHSAGCAAVGKAVVLMAAARTHHTPCECILSVAVAGAVVYVLEKLADGGDLFGHQVLVKIEDCNPAVPATCAQDAVCQRQWLTPPMHRNTSTSEGICR